MEQHEIEGLIKNIDTRTKRIEQILPTLATKDDLQAFATKDEMREEGVRTRRHIDVVAEELKTQIKSIAEGQKALGEHITKSYDELSGRIVELGQDIKSVLANHERRIAKLEAGASKRR